MTQNPTLLLQSLLDREALAQPTGIDGINMWANISQAMSLDSIAESLKVVAGQINSVETDELRISLEEIWDFGTPEDIASKLLSRYDIRRKVEGSEAK